MFHRTTWSLDRVVVQGMSGVTHASGYGASGLGTATPCCGTTSLGHTGVVSGLGTTGLVANSVGPSGQGSGLGGNTLSVWISGVLTLANIIECTVAG